MTSDGASTIGRSGSYAKGVARRREILDRAIEVFADRGADGTSLRRIAQTLGVSHAALLHYFDSREQLLVAVYEHAEAIRDHDPRGGRPSGAVEIVVDAAMRNVEVPGLVQLYSTLVAAALEADSIASRDFFASRFDRIRALLAHELERDQDAGRVRADVAARDLAALIVAASDGLQVQWLLEPTIELQATLSAFHVLLAPPGATATARP